MMEIFDIESFIKAKHTLKSGHKNVPNEMRFVHTVLSKLVEQGYSIGSVNDGEAIEKVTNSLEALDHVFGVEESSVKLNKDDENYTLYIILGNFDGTAFYDWSDRLNGIDEIIKEAQKTYYPALWP